MPFRRRSPAGWAEKIRTAVWPRKGVTRNLRYYGLRAARISASPHAVAAGIAAGAMAGWTPFLGFHIILGVALAFVLRGSLVAAALGTLVANPLTFPLIWSISWEIGHAMLGHAGEIAGRQVDLAELVRTLHFADLWQPVLKPMLLGSLPPALVSGLVLYVATYMGVKGFRARRRERMAANVAARLHAMPKVGV